MDWRSFAVVSFRLVTEDYMLSVVVSFCFGSYLNWLIVYTDLWRKALKYILSLEYEKGKIVEIIGKEVKKISTLFISDINIISIPSVI